MKYNFTPKGIKSLKVLSECPLCTVMMYQMHKNIINQEIGEIVAEISKIIVLKPTDEQKKNNDLKEIIAEFVTVQVRALSFIVYFKNNKVIFK